MSSFKMFIELGFEHITDLNGLDHMLFLLALCGVYRFQHWKKVLIVITLFTIFHSISLALAAFNVVKTDKNFIEFLIPLTILFTAFFNLTKLGQNTQNTSKYYIASLFGLIHGFGFSTFYKMVVLDTHEWYKSYIPFNLGIELGQILIVFIILAAATLAVNVLNIKAKDWNLYLSGGVSGLSTLLLIENWPF